MLIALGVAGGVGSAWETVLLWQHRVPFGPDPATPVTDPIFDQDIGFFLFELPFLRLVQGARERAAHRAPVLVLGRYLAVAASRRRGLHTQRPGPPRRSSARCSSWSIAFGYQLDKYALVYSTRGVAERRVSYTDQNAQFFAYDLLAVLSP